MKRKIAAIMAADVASYSRLVAEDEEETLTRLAAFREVFDDFVKRYGGRIFNTAGDSVMSEFDSAVEATRAAIDIQEALRTRNLAYPPSRRLEFRIGITIGDVVERNGDLLGDGVNIAARLEGLSDPGGICISRSVYEAVANKVSVPFKDIGEREVKNIPTPVHAFVAAWTGEKGRSELRAERRSDRVRDERGRSQRDERPHDWGAFLYRRRWLVIVLLIVFVVVPGMRALRRALDPPPNTPAIETPAEPKSRMEQREQRRSQEKARTDAKQAKTGADNAALDPSQAFANLSRDQGLVANARTAPEIYHNARVLEARGDALGARRAYLELANLGQEFVDPHLRFSALLRVQDGRAGAREVYSELMATHPAKIVTLMHALQFEGAERKAKVDAFAAENPDFGPASYFQADEFSEDRLGVQTLTDRRLEFDALDRFLDAERDGRLTRYFLDQSVLAQWLDRARRRKAAIEAFFKTASTRPTASFTRSNGGWTASLFMPEPATSITYRIGEEGQFKSTGTSAAIDQRTGKPAPMPVVVLPADQEKSTIYVSYDDAAGRTAGPFVITFDPRAALISSERQILELTSNSWLSFANDRDLLYYTHLLSYRCAIKEALIGYDGEEPQTELPLPACDERDPFAIPPDVKPYLAVPSSVDSVSVKLAFVDGGESEVKTFRRP